MSAARFGIDMWYCYISLRLTDLCAHSIIGFAIAEDEELIIAEEFLNGIVSSSNIIYIGCYITFGCKLT